MQWTLDFQKEHDGTLLASGSYIQYLTYNRIIERLYQYVLEPEKQLVKEDVFVARLAEHCKSSLDRSGITVGVIDEALLKEFYQKLITRVREALELFEDAETKKVLYELNQVRLGNEESYRLVKEHYGLTQRMERKLDLMFEQIQRWIGQNGPELDDAWFLRQNSETIQNMGKRYLPKMNVELEIQKNFQIIAAEEAFFSELEEREKSLRSIFDRAKDVTPELESARAELKNNLQKFRGIQGVAEYRENVIAALVKCEKEAEIYYHELLEEQRHGDRTWTYGEINRYYELKVKVGEFRVLLEQKAMQMVEHPYMVLYGEGGIGKSHLIADTVVKRNQNEEKSILLLGQDFPAECVIWSRFEELLRLKWPMDIVLERMNEIAQMQRKRILIFIDAINEGVCRAYWNVFPGMSGSVWSCRSEAILCRKYWMRSCWNDIILQKSSISASV